METREYHTVDKSDWMDGPWKDEPDKIQWPDPATGLPCLIVRGPSGALCGYVGVPDSHPWHGKSYGDEIGDCVEACTADDHYGHTIGSHISVHGGLTFSDACAHDADEAQHICHVPAPGEPDNVWWFGFDCAHCGDMSPKYLDDFPDGLRGLVRETYKELSYVREQVTQLAQQLVTLPFAHRTQGV